MDDCIFSIYCTLTNSFPLSQELRVKRDRRKYLIDAVAWAGVGSNLGVSIGAAIGGPIGAAVGAVIGAALGGLLGLITCLFVCGTYNDLSFTLK